jgi:hypothetical protein
LFTDYTYIRLTPAFRLRKCLALNTSILITPAHTTTKTAEMYSRLVGQHVDVIELN